MNSASVRGWTGRSVNCDWATNYRVPVAGGDAGHELIAPGGGEVVLARHQQTGQRVEVLELFGELLEDVIRDQDQALVGQTEPAQLHRRGRHDRRLPGAYLMEQADGRLLEDAPNGCFLVGSQTER